jgi:ADP-ribose pyrophosphatase
MQAAVEDNVMQNARMKPWKTLSRRTVFQHERFLSVELHEVGLPDGRVIHVWPWIVTPDYVNVLAETHDGRFLCFRQTKYAVEGVSLAPVGGYIEPGEAPEAAARRELLEETGYASPDWIHVGTYAVDANRGVGKAYLFIARRATRVTSPSADDLEEQELLLLSRADLEHALGEGEFKVLAWAAAVALGLRRLE